MNYQHNVENTCRFSSNNFGLGGLVLIVDQTNDVIASPLLDNTVDQPGLCCARVHHSDNFYQQLKILPREPVFQKYLTQGFLNYDSPLPSLQVQKVFVPQLGLEVHRNPVYEI